ncbi:amidohydrolase [Pseudomonas sp. RIT-To-2]|uniref:amidohydrolase n=1 Tax=Pseudomonas sp. RIT-To-2 TaxID=3462541 RepID=UPI0024132DFA
MEVVADLIVVNAKVRTMDEKCPFADAIAVSQGRIVAVGTQGEVETWARHGTTRIDAGGRLVLPGFQDTHIHFQQSSADQFHNVSLHDIETVDQLLSVIHEFAVANPGNPWIRGVGFNPALFTPDELTKELLDGVTGTRPALMLASDYHNGWANSAAFQIADVAPGSQDPENGQYLRLPDGSPKGWIVEDAIWAMAHVAPSFTQADYITAMEHFCKVFNRRGVTGVLDALVNRRNMEAYQACYERGNLTLRVCATAKVFAHKELDQQLLELRSLRDEFNTDHVRMHSAKFFLDGVLENGTAVLLEPRTDDGLNAALMFDQGQINEFFAAFDRAGFQLHVHTIGDGAVRAALNGIEFAQKVNGRWDSRHQLAHLQVVDPSDIPRFKHLGVIANYQTFWAQPHQEFDAVVSRMLGKFRSEWVYPIGAFVKQGIPCMLSSDWGVTTYDPFQIIQCAVTRQNPTMNSSEKPHTPQHRISVEAAVKGYTISAAYAAWRENVTGSLTVGKYADLIVLDRDIFEVSPYEIAQTEVLLTLLEGKVVHCQDGFI